MEFLSILTFRPDPHVFRLVNTPIEVVNDNYNSSFNDVNKNYYYTDLVFDESVKLFKDILEDLHLNTGENFNISNKVYNQSIDFLDQLYPTILQKLNESDIYSTEYGTVVIDWEKDSENIFSIEIGSHLLGYFIEENGSDIKQIDALPLNDVKTELLKDLSDFLNL